MLAADLKMMISFQYCCKMLVLKKRYAQPVYDEFLLLLPAPLYLKRLPQDYITLSFYNILNM